MKFRLIQRLAGLLLTASLLFNQAGVGYLHDVHDAHKELTSLNTELLVPHGDHCKICSIDVLFNLYFSTPDQLTVAFTHSSATVEKAPQTRCSIASPTRNKAPPADSHFA